MKKHIPNLLTLLNLFFGIISILLIAREEFYMATYFFIGSLICDFLDGFLARLLNVQGELGKQLDSLSDLISFGLAPAFIMYKLMHLGLIYGDCDCTFIKIPETDIILKTLFGFVIAVYSALRLAKFNIDFRQTSTFLGLPTPANAIFIYSLPLIMISEPQSWIAISLRNYNVLLGITFILSILVISELPLLSLKLKNISFIDNKYLYSIIIISLFLISILKIVAIPIIIIVYILISLLKFQLEKSK